MTRSRILLLSAAGVVALLGLTVVTGVLVARSDWFRERVRQRIVEEAEKATNGRVEVGAFRFDWSTLTAELDNVTIHGTEAAGQAPMLAVKRLVIGLKVISLLERAFDIARVEADSPSGHLIIQADGEINIPPPHKFRPQVLLDLKVGKFAAKDGVILVETPGQKPRRIPWNV